MPRRDATPLRHGLHQRLILQTGLIRHFAASRLQSIQARLLEFIRDENPQD
jgi:hypothetical protein